jgi:outer membrane protein assembly factor BamB
MNCLNYLLLVSIVLFHTSCQKSTEPVDNDIPPPGYQEDIPWPSLADSPWPMNHGDPQSTGRSKYPGPMAGIIDWSIDSLWVESGISIGYDQSVYFNSNGYLRGLIAANPDGSIKWKLEEVITNNIVATTPLVAADGTIYIGGGLLNRLFAINFDGTLKWEFETNGFVYHVGMNLGLDGTIYFLSGSWRNGVPTLYAVNPDGSLKWNMENSDFNYFIDTGISFSPDGKTLYLPGINPSVFAIDVENQIIKWTFGEILFNGSVLVDSEGHLYFQSQVESINSGKASLFSLNPDGSVRWSYAHDNPDFSSSHMADGTMDKNGNYYFALDTLYSLDYEGNLRWKIGLEKYSGEPLTCDINGVVYLPLWVGTSIAAVSSEGEMIWQVDFPPTVSMGQSPALGNDQRMYIASFENYFVYAIK